MLNKSSSYTLSIFFVTLLNILHYNTIPVVFGGSHYDSMVSENSVMKVNDFPTPKALGKYLIRVSQDPQLYLSYFEWKKYYVAKNQPHRLRYAFCQSCDLIIGLSALVIKILLYGILPKHIIYNNCWQ